MHPLGIHTHLYRGEPATIAEVACRHGLACVQLTPNFPGLPFYEPGQFTPPRCRAASQPFLERGLAIAAVSSHCTLLNPDLDRRHRGIVRLHRLIQACRDFGTRCAVTEIGEPETGRPTTESWSELCYILEPCLQLAEEAGVMLLLKPGPGQLGARGSDLLRLRQHLPYPTLGWVLDPADLLQSPPPDNDNSELEWVVNQLGPFAPLVHAKDLRHDGSGFATSPAGRGTLDFSAFFRLLRPVQPAAPVILEHVRKDEVEVMKNHLHWAQTAGIKE
jgi:sugar phosphate isomerase/epimerase